MKRTTVAFAAAACVVLVAACGGPTTETEKAAIDAINKKWMEAIAAKDASAIAAVYAEDGQMLPPNTTKAVGRDAIKKGWEGFLGLPGMQLTFETEKFELARSADLAVEIQTYKLTTGEGAEQITDTGKGVVTWVKRDGKWLVLTDMFSSDLPPPAANPAPDPTLAAPVNGTAPAPSDAPATPAAAAAEGAAHTAPATPAPATPGDPAAKPPGQ
jgi:uncharacterized protein (TIGR02246 family)